VGGTRVYVTALALAGAGACGGSHNPAPPDAGRCDPTIPFGAAMPISELETKADDLAARLTPDELTIVFARGTAPPTYDLYEATRAHASDPFGAPALLASVNSVYSDTFPSLSPDQLSLFFDSTRTSGMVHIYTSHRTTSSDPFGPPSAVLAVSDGEDHALLASASALYFASALRTGLGMHDLWHADVDASGTVGTPSSVIGPVNSGDDEDYPVLTSDELQLYFVRTNATGSTLYETTRAAATEPFTTPMPITDLVPPGSSSIPSWVSPDGCHLYLSSDAPGMGGSDLYMASR
jgi:hypothetical protein